MIRDLAILFIHLVATTRLAGLFSEAAMIWQAVPVELVALAVSALGPEMQFPRCICRTKLPATVVVWKIDDPKGRGLITSDRVSVWV